ncbi:MAG TPA: NlpC/P60 family protein [Flavobacterium sp.]|nr:NlpC/P60 family protein [Flavobacterium sp.]HQX03062.1 NlpC/P60 family protein [Flavobacterium sp.]HRZ30822.1 NlpC/P60 family protein [Flavobacterium sp.]HRZ73509.1 NlpC/P60 family protein [Flavobacterium sp.]
MKNTVLITFLLLFLVSCKPTTSVIVTSKEEAQKKGIYKAPQPNKATVSTNKSAGSSSVKKGTENTKSEKKHKITDVEDTDFVADNDNTSYFIKQLINTAMQYNGVRYRGGGTTTAGMDCSGLVTTVFKTYDVSLPRSSNDMSKVGEKLNRNEIKKGDLVFFRTNGRSVINHVGLVTEVKDDEIIFIHSSVQRGVIISSTKEPYYQRTFAQANRILGDEYF